MQQPTVKVISTKNQYEELFREFLDSAPAIEKMPPGGVIIEENIVAMFKKFEFYCT